MKDSENSVALRPHHIVCIQHFVGHGYDDEFTENMTKVINSLCSDTPVNVRLGTDILCSCCPHNENGICKEQSRVMHMDRACANILGISEGDTLPYGDLVSAITRYIEKNGLPDICLDCEWLSICLDVRSKKSSEK